MSFNIKPQGGQVGATSQLQVKKTPTSPQGQESFKSVMMDEAKASVKSTNQINSRSLQFSINDETGDIVIQVIDKETEAVVRTIPQTEMQQYISSVKAKSGGFINTRI